MIYQLSGYKSFYQLGNVCKIRHWAKVFEDIRIYMCSSIVFSKGTNSAFFKSDCITPSDSDMFTILVMTGKRESMHFFNIRRLVGIGSWEQDLDFVYNIIFLTSSCH